MRPMPLQLLFKLFTPAADYPAIREPAQHGKLARDVSFDEQAVAVRSLTAALLTVIRPGDVLLLSAPNCAEFTVSFLAGLGAGAKVFLLSPDLTDVEIRAVAEEVSPAMLIGGVSAIKALSGRI